MINHQRQSLPNNLATGRASATARGESNHINQPTAASGSRAAQQLRRFLAIIATFCLALTGLITLEAPAQAADRTDGPWVDSTVTRSIKFDGLFGPTNGMYAVVGSKTTVTMPWSDTRPDQSKKIKLICGMPGVPNNEDQTTTTAGMYSGTLSLTFTPPWVGTMNCQTWFEDANGRWIDQGRVVSVPVWDHYTPTFYTWPMCRQNSDPTDGPIERAAGEASNCRVGIRRGNQPPDLQVSMQWSVTPRLPENTLKPEDETAVFTPTKAGTYTISAKIIGGWQNDGNLVREMEMVVLPAVGDSETAAIEQTATEAIPGETVEFTPSMSDAFGNAIPQDRLRATFATGNAGDTFDHVKHTLTLGKALGRRAIEVSINDTKGSDSKTVTAHVTVVRPPQIVMADEPASPVAVVDQPFTLPFQVAGESSVTVTADRLPGGLRLHQSDPDNWRITGQPTEIGSFRINLTASYGRWTDTKEVVLVVRPEKNDPKSSPSNNNPSSGSNNQPKHTVDSSVGESLISGGITGQEMAQVARNGAELVWGGGATVRVGSGTVTVGAGKASANKGIGARLAVPSHLVPRGWK
ncbi:MAG: hypothetical protein LBG70_00955, partial [Bifidobacteriaceae bacterium]|nr:hypothetical protein [Bifidobacteriaceae bacterium]